MKVFYQIFGAQELINKLGNADRRIPSTLRKVVWKTLLRVQAIAKKKLSGKVLKVRENRLRSSVQAMMIKEGPTIFEGVCGTRVIYGAVHEFGMTIFPRRAPFLVFESGGQIMRMKSVTIPSRPWLMPSLDEARPKIKPEAGRTILGMLRGEGLV